MRWKLRQCVRWLATSCLVSVGGVTPASSNRNYRHSWPCCVTNWTPTLPSYLRTAISSNDSMSPAMPIWVACSNSRSCVSALVRQWAPSLNTFEPTIVPKLVYLADLFVPFFMYWWLVVAPLVLNDFGFARKLCYFTEVFAPIIRAQFGLPETCLLQTTLAYVTKFSTSMNARLEFYSQLLDTVVHMDDSDYTLIISLGPNGECANLSLYNPDARSNFDGVRVGVSQTLGMWWSRL